MKYVNKPNVKRGKLYLGSGKVQRRAFLPLLEIASRFMPIISLPGEILGKGQKKYIKEEK